jgi:hypothetical protein
LRLNSDDVRTHHLDIPVATKATYFRQLKSVI